MAREGWNWLINSRKWHYFQADGRSLCGRYAILGDNADSEQGGEGSPDNCQACVRKRAAQVQREADTKAPWGTRDRQA